MSEKVSIALTIAGSDCSGGAGIQADLKTFAAHGVYGMSVITALTAQNTRGVRDVLNSTPGFLEAQMDAVFEDIFPDAVKIGMVSNSELIYTIRDGLKKWKPRNIVIDPVMVSTSGHRLLDDEAEDSLFKHLLPLADLITPNLYEAEILADMKIKSADDIVVAAKKISAGFGGGILIKGGHSMDNADDYLYYNGEGLWFRGSRIENPNAHGTGCTLSSAVAAGLAVGNDLISSIKSAKEYITGALCANLDIGTGRGPINHMYNLKSK